MVGGWVGEGDCSGEVGVGPCVAWSATGGLEGAREEGEAEGAAVGCPLEARPPTTGLLSVPAAAAPHSAWPGQRHFPAALSHGLNPVPPTPNPTTCCCPGGIKRWGFARGNMTHGSKSKREHGSTGPGSTPGRVFPGLKAAGQMGNVRAKLRKVEVSALGFRRGGAACGASG